MLSPASASGRFRYSFGSISIPVQPPNLLAVQLDSYNRFLQKDSPPDKRKNEGLEAVFRSIFPISDFSGSSTLEYVHYRLGDPQYTVDECRIRGVTFSAPLRVALRLIVWEKDSDSEAKHIHDIKEQDIYLGELPLMTHTGSFIINGTERVIVSQMHKSPGVFFAHDKGKTHSSGKILYSARLIPQRGSWIDFELDAKEHLYVRIDRKRKFFATIFLRSLGYSEEEFLFRLRHVGQEIVTAEQGARKTLLDAGRTALEDRAGRAVGLAGHAHLTSFPEALGWLSSIRLGVDLGLTPGHDIAALNSLLLRTQGAHLEAASGLPCEALAVNAARASLLRGRFS